MAFSAYNVEVDQSSLSTVHYDLWRPRAVIPYVIPEKDYPTYRINGFGTVPVGVSLRVEPRVVMHAPRLFRALTSEDEALFAASLIASSELVYSL